MPSCPPPPIAPTTAATAAAAAAAGDAGEAGEAGEAGDRTPGGGVADYSTLTAADAAAIGRRYGLDLVDVRPLPGGMTNSSFLARDRPTSARPGGAGPGRRFIVTVLDDHDRVSAVALADLMDHLAGAGLATPTPVRTADGVAITDWDDKPVMVKHYVAGTLEHPLAARHLPAVGAYLARLHGLAAPPGVPVGGRSLPADWADQLQGRSGDDDRRSPEPGKPGPENPGPEALEPENPEPEAPEPEKPEPDVVAMIAAAQRHEPRWRHLPAGLIHGDLFDDNVVIAPDDDIVVLDWETASVEPLVLDLGMAAVGLCRIDNRFEATRFEALVAGYETVRPLRADEHAGLPAAIEYATALLVFNRFMRHRVHRPDERKQDLHRELVDFAATLPSPPPPDAPSTRPRPPAGRMAGEGAGATLLLAMSPSSSPSPSSHPPTATGSPLLGDLTSLRLGGPAGRLLTAGTPDAIAAALAAVPSPADPRSVLVLGGGTNVIVADDGFAGTVVRVAGGSIAVSDRSTGDGTVELAVDAGVDWDHFVATAVGHGCRGVEMMSGVPGAVGASPIQNIGAYGQQVADVIDRVEVIDRATLEPSVVTADECRFGFRTSRFKTEWRDRFVVTRVHVRLAAAEASPPEPSTYVDIERYFARTGRSPVDLHERREAVLATRRTKSMLLDPDDPNARSVGSFFINPTVDTALARRLAEQFQTLGLNVQYLEGRTGANPPDRTRIPAAHLLRYAGYHPGDSWGPVKLSDKHVLALVANPGATAADVWMVGHAVQARVRELTGIELHFEATFIGDFPPFDAGAFERAYRYEPGPDQEPAWLTSYRSR